MAPQGANSDWLDFHARLMLLRRKLGLKQIQMWSILGGSGRPSPYSHLESGQALSIKLTHLENLCLLAQREGVSLEWLLLGRGEFSNNDPNKQSAETQPGPDAGSRKDEGKEPQHVMDDSVQRDGAVVAS
ncbi:hypothetical protein LCGC14_3067700 [marine sediment metagenome]|uniref:Uncharacterized protein n=1 Tax=marine sediment metagenome TaxID=412755 RepID=A0A0F8WGX4_9ZZZZ